MSSHDESQKYQHGDPPVATGLDATVIVSPDSLKENRIPPGQSRTRKWPVLDASGTPRFDAAQWKLRIFGAVEQAVTLSIEQFHALPRVRVFADFHCVTHWSRLGNLWEGVATRELLKLARPLPEAKYVICHAYDNNWTTNLPLGEFLADDALLADRHDGQPISLDHGGPVRGMVPRLYAWKSAKWICGIELTTEDSPGYWERAGYHLRGDPWAEQRFRDDDAYVVRHD